MAIASSKLSRNSFAKEMRERIVQAMHEIGEPISPKGLSILFEINISKIAYYMKTLRENGAIEEVHRKQRRGAMEHFYVLTEGTVIEDDTALERISGVLSNGHSPEKALEAISGIVKAAGYSPSS